MSTGGWLILLLFAAAIVIIVYRWLQTDYDESGRGWLHALPFDGIVMESLF